MKTQLNLHKSLTLISMLAMLLSISCSSVPEETKQKAKEYIENIESKAGAITFKTISLYDESEGLLGNLLAGFDTVKTKEMASKLNSMKSLLNSHIKELESMEEFSETDKYSKMTLEYLQEYKDLANNELTAMVNHINSEFNPDYIMKLDSCKLKVLQKLQTIEKKRGSVKADFRDKYDLAEENTDSLLKGIEESISQLKYKMESLNKILQMK